MPPKGNNINRRRRRRASDATYSGRKPPRIPQGAPRHTGRHTRSHWAGPLVEGLQHSQMPEIANVGLVTATPFSAVGLAPPPPLGVQPIPAQRARPIAFSTAPVQVQSRMQRVFGITKIRERILSNLNRAEQDNVRLISKFVADATPAFHLLTGVQLHIQSSSIRCQNRCFPARVARPPAQGEPGPPHAVYPLQVATVQRIPCTRTHSAQPGPRYRPCDGPRVLWDGVVPRPTFHAEVYTICSVCAYEVWGQYNLDLWFGERSVPLCFQCSADKIHSESWKLCRCKWEMMPDRYTQTNPDQRYYFCSDCRKFYMENLVSRLHEKCEDELKLRIRPNATLPHPHLYTTWDLVKARVHDTDPVYRNYCRCGLSFRDIAKTHPRRVAPMNHLPDFRWLFRECLVCGYHVATHNPTTQPSTCY